jgi:hypothetical protein
MWQHVYNTRYDRKVTCTSIVINRIKLGGPQLHSHLDRNSIHCYRGYHKP